MSPPQARLVEEIEGWIVRSMPYIMRRSLRRGLNGVWAGGTVTLPAGGCVLAANHHSWWDGYLLWLLATQQGRAFSGMVDDETLGRFRFFRRMGAVGRGELREAVRRLQAGHVFVVFPEGALSPPGEVRALHPGAVFLAEQAKVPLVPVALRVVLRGAERPDAYLKLGEAVATSSREGAEVMLEQALNTMLTELDEAVRRAPAETPLPGVTPLLPGRRSFHLRAAWVRRLWPS